VRLAVKRLLADPGYAARAAEVRAWCDTHDGAVTAADELDAFGRP
jgi:UDP:flavonoid glycosyltransferase YjiC (YdhE family)